MHNGGSACFDPMHHPDPRVLSDSDSTEASVYGRGAKTGIFAATRVAAAGLSMAAVLVACGDDEREVEPRPAPVIEEHEEPELAYRTIELEDGGSIGGVVRWVGPMPELAPIEVRAGREVCGESQPSPTLRVSERRGVSDVVVWLTDVRAGRAFEPPAEAPTIELRGCRYAPHVIAVGVGWSVRFANADPILHNVHGVAGGETVLDVGLPERGASATHAFDAPGPVRVVCDAGHGWELAWVHAFEHPYFAVSREDGRYRIDDVPPGQYVLQAWHEGWRADGTRAGRPRLSNPIVLTRTVSVSPRQETSVDFQLSEQAAEIAGAGR